MESCNLFLNQVVISKPEALLLEALPILLKQSTIDKNKNLVLLTGNAQLEIEQVKTFFSSLKKENIVIHHFVIDSEPTCLQIDNIVHQLRCSKIEPFYVVGLGGGSVIDSGKAISFLLKEREDIVCFLEKVGTKTPSGNKIPFMAIATTSGTGSEATKNGVIKGNIDGVAFKSSFRHDNFIPNVAICDPALLSTIPLHVTYYTAMDALAQLLESFTSTKYNPFCDAVCESGLISFALGFDSTILDGNDIEARFDMAYAAWASGVSLCNVGLGAIHGIAGVLGALSDIPHGAACAILLPIVIEAMIRKLVVNATIGSFNFRFLVKLARAGYLLNGELESGFDISCGCKKLLAKLESFKNDFDFGTLSKYGFTTQQIPSISQLCENKNSPVQFNKKDFEAILFSAITGNELSLPKDGSDDEPCCSSNHEDGHCCEGEGNCECDDQGCNCKKS